MERSLRENIKYVTSRDFWGKELQSDSNFVLLDKTKDIDGKKCNAMYKDQYVIIKNENN